MSLQESASPFESSLFCPGPVSAKGCIFSINWRKRCVFQLRQRAFRDAQVFQPERCKPSEATLVGRPHDVGAEARERVGREIGGGKRNLAVVIRCVEARHGRGGGGVVTRDTGYDVTAGLGLWLHVSTLQVAAVTHAQHAVVLEDANLAVRVGPAGGAAILLGRGVQRAAAVGAGRIHPGRPGARLLLAAAAATLRRRPCLGGHRGGQERERE